MIENSLFFYPYASFTNAQLPLLKVAALWFDKLVILDPFGASWVFIGDQLETLHKRALPKGSRIHIHREERTLMKNDTDRRFWLFRP